jgi:ankyrin repeat protein
MGPVQEATMGDEDDLLAAMKKDDVGRARDILVRNPLILRMRTPNGTLVLTAVYHGSAATLKLLLERTPEDALTLHEAAATGNERRLKTILGQSRVRVNAANAEGFTPLGLAAFFGHLDAVKVLLERGADVNLKPPSRFANTALDAAVAGDHGAVVKTLLAARADPNPRSEGNYTPLHKAAAHGNSEIVRLLLDAGADPTATRDGGHTPIDDAREKGHAAVVGLLEDRLR